MTCAEAEMDLIGGASERSAVLVEHLSQCPSCARFARVQVLAFQASPSAAPSAALDQRVLTAAREVLASRRRWLRLRQFGGGVLVPLAAAALVMVGLWLRLGPQGASVAKPAGEVALASAPAVAAVASAPALAGVSADDAWLMVAAMTDAEMDELEQGLARVLAGGTTARMHSAPGSASGAATGPASKPSAVGLTDFSEQLMALEFELLGEL